MHSESDKRFGGALHRQGLRTLVEEGVNEWVVLQDGASVEAERVEVEWQSGGNEQDSEWVAGYIRGQAQPHGVDQWGQVGDDGVADHHQ